MKKTWKTFIMIAVMFAMTAVYFPPAPEVGAAATLVGSWSLNEGTGTTAGDSSGSGANGTIASGSWTSGVVGGALQFNGTSTNVSMGNPSALNIASDSLTIATWFKTSTTGVSRLVSKGNYGWTDGYFLSIGHGAPGRLAMAIGAGGNQSNTLFIYTQSAFNDNQWHHVAGVFDRTANEMSIYVDGVKQAITKVAGTGGTVSNGNTLSFGTVTGYATHSTTNFTLGSHNGSAERFNGTLDQVNLYHGALSDMEIAGLRAASDPGLLAWWDLNEGGGTSVADAWRRSSNGMIVNGATWQPNGSVGTALSFNGTNQSVGMGTPSILNPIGNTLTLSAWFRTNATGLQRIVSKGNYGWTNGYFLSIGHGAAGRVAASIGGGGNQANTIFIYSNNSYNDNQWHHAVAIFNESTKRAILYVDGVQQGLSMVPGTAGTIVGGNELDYASAVGYNASSTSDFRLGSHIGSAEFMDGMIDQVRVYDRAISATEIAAMYGEKTANVTVNYGTLSGMPAEKKISLFNSGLVSLSRHASDFAKVQPLRPDNFRVEIGIGNDAYPYADTVYGTATSLQYDYTNLDTLMDYYTSNGTLPYVAYSYTPKPLQASGDWQKAPSDMNKWASVTESIANHFKTENIPVAYHEIFNEPDLSVFFTGTWAEYLDIYKHGVNGILQGNQDAVVGGPSTWNIATMGTKLTGFMNYVKTENLPLDFFSMHRYGIDYASQLSTARTALSSDSRFATTEIHLNEYNTDEHPWPIGGPTDFYRTVPDMLTSIEYFMNQPDLTVVNWAQFMDSGAGDALGLINEAGFKKASYNALEAVARMPVDRVQVTSTNTTIKTMATKDSHRASLLIWNPSEQVQNLTVSLGSIPFASGSFKVYRIDGEHASRGDNSSSESLVPVQTNASVSTAGLNWNGTIPGKGTIYIEVDDNSGFSELDSVSIGEIVRTHHYYPFRGAQNYAQFDRDTWIARLGMGSETWADSLVGATVTDLPTTLNVTTEVIGTLAALDVNSVLGIRIDYEVSGSYTKGVMFHNGLYNSSRYAVMPWGTKRKPDQDVHVSSFSSFQIKPADYAPSGWSGRAIISFDMQNSGVNTRAKFTIRP